MVHELRVTGSILFRCDFGHFIQINFDESELLSLQRSNSELLRKLNNRKLFELM